MSYDIYIQPASLRPDEHDELWWRNYTSNVARMWRAAMPATDGLAGLDGMICRDAIGPLEAGFAAMQENPKIFKAMNPRNGWGRSEPDEGSDGIDVDRCGAIGIISVLLAACREYPDAQIKVSR